MFHQDWEEYKITEGTPVAHHRGEQTKIKGE